MVIIYSHCPQSPVPSPQSPVPSPQSPVPSHQSPVPSPQSPVTSPQSPVPSPLLPIDKLFILEKSNYKIKQDRRDNDSQSRYYAICGTIRLPCDCG
ncbi:hypothetical protein [Sphaerospermopsis sp. FACHB-1194]|uniref:hypothetical protein n=1 Tax=Sphaerospermopsis sp. FACHB-1194 TaxID=2692862 RepID=UPI001680DDF1|nr:hypothetical protein [Sphaerospermopsis sp. FACHB-1194]MBD2144612.1 hypothetical protein [Sphaerospermopsis sp. FACHB-1194]